MTDNSPQQVVFIDSRVPDIQDLLAGVQPGERVYVLDPDSDGLSQIADILAADNLTNLSTISIVSHGSVGEVTLGSTAVTDSSLDSHASALAEIGAALGAGGTLQLFGCDVGQGAAGQQFVNDLATLAGGINVAAATHDVGSAALGGSWTLDADSEPNPGVAVPPAGSATNVAGAVPIAAVHFHHDHSHQTNSHQADPRRTEPQAGSPTLSAPFSQQALDNFQGLLANPVQTELWITSSGGGEATSLLDVDDNGGAGSVDNTTLWSPTSANRPTQVSQIVNIALDPTNETYFIVQDNEGVGGSANEIWRGSLTQELGSPSGTPSLTSIFSQTGAVSATGEITGIGLDTTNEEVYFTEGHSLLRESYNGGPVTTLATGGSNVFANGLALDLAHNQAFFFSTTTFSTSTTNGAPITTVGSNAIYVDSNLGASTVATPTQLTLSPADPNIAGGKDFPVSLGVISGIAVDTVTEKLYFTTDPVPNPTTHVRGTGGVYEYDLINHTYSAVWVEPSTSSLFFSYIQIDDATNSYYVSDTNETTGTGIYKGSLSGGAPTLFTSIAPSTVAMAPQGFAFDNAPTLSITPTSPTFTESTNNPASLNNTPVVLLSSEAAADSDNTELVSAQVTIGGFFVGDTLTFANNNNITGSYNSTTGVLTFSGVDTFAHYQTALASVQFTSTSDNPTDFGSDTTRGLSWTVNDGLISSAPQTETITVVGVNDPPTLSNVATTAHYTEGGSAAVLSNALTVFDPDNLDLASATVSIAAGTFANDGDVLAASTAGTNITASYNSTSEVLTLTGSDTLQHYQQVLDSVSFSSTSLNPTDYGSSTTRQVTWLLNDGSGASNLSTTSTTTVGITAVNSPPTLTGISATVSFTEKGSSVALSTGVTVSDPDNLTLAGATVKIAGGTFAGDGDVLAANVVGTSITASYNAATEALVLSGSDTFADYQAVLDTVTFNSSSLNPTDFGSNTTRTVTWTLNDGSTSNQLSTAQTTIIDVTAVNDPPTLSNVATTAGFTEGTAVTLSNAVTVADPDNLDIASATVSVVSGAFAGDADVLSVNGQTSGTIIGGGGTITVSYNASTETLVLSGSDTLADYQSALDKVTFNSTSDNPDNLGANPTRSVTWVIDDGASPSAVQTTTVNVTAVNDPPTLTGTANASFTENSAAAVTLSPNVTVTDPDNLTLASATVALTGGTFAGDGDVLAATAVGAILVSYNAANETLVLSGVDTLADYQQVLDSVTFTTASNNPTDFGADPTRTVVWTLNDGSASNAAGTATSTIGVTAINDPPTLSNVAASITVLPSVVTTLSPSITVADPDNLNLASATVAITGGTFAGDGDILGATVSGTNITASYDAAAETLVLTGADTLAHYQQVLDSVTFDTAAADPTNGGADPNRTVSWAANDGSASFSSSTVVTTDVVIQQGPGIGPAASATWTEGGPATTLSPSVALSDTNGTVLVSATVALTSGDISNGTFMPSGQPTSDLLTADTSGTNITAVYNSTTETLTLTGVDTLADYRKVLDSVAFSSGGDNPADYGSDPTRLVTWTVSDGTASHSTATATSTISVIDVNDPPTVSGVPATASFSEGGSAVTLAPSIALTDPDNLTLTSATVQITGGTFVGDGDVLATDTSGTSITASYNASTETLLLTGIDTLADYRAVLSRVTFNSTSLNPTDFGVDPTRTITWTADDGGSSFNVSTTQTIALSVTPVNNPPTLAGTADASFTEGGAAVTLSGSAVVSDPDGQTLTSATVALTGGTFTGDGDLLAVNGISNGIIVGASGNITVGYNSTTETLTLTGADTLADYQLLLDAVTFVTPSDNPTDFGADPTRTVVWTLNDGSGGIGTATTTVSIAATNDPPTLTGTRATVSFTEGVQVVLANAAAVTDPDNRTLASGTVAITGGTFAGDGDLLSALTSGTSITASYNTSTETLLLTGTDTLAHYQQVLDSIVFNSGLNPDNFGADPTRTVVWTLNDGSASNATTTATTTIDVTAVNSRPTLSGTANVSFTEKGPAVTVSAGAAVSDPDSQTLASATVAIVGGAFAGDGDVLSVNGATSGTIVENGHTISISYNAATETLTLAGTDTPADYQAALDQVTFFTPSVNPTDFGSSPTRTVVWTLNDGSTSNATSATTTTINVTAVNDPPTLTGTANANFTEKAGPVVLSGGAAISDPDNLTLRSATVAVAAGAFTGDVLAASTAGTNITASYNSASETLILTGSDTLLHYQAVLDSVTFNSTSLNPTDYGSDTHRTLVWTVNDGSASSATASATTTLNVTGVNDPPTLSNVAAVVPFRIGHTVTVSPGLAVSDPDSLRLAGATVAIHGFFVGDGDVLSVNTAGTAIAASYNSTTETLTLTGSDTAADYQHVLDSLTFSSGINPSNSNSNLNPSRTLTWVVNDGAGSNNLSTPATTTITIQPTIKNDFNGDQISDLLFQDIPQPTSTGGRGHGAGDPNAGAAQAWLFNGSGVTAQAILPNPGASWRLAGTGDFNADGNADIVWQSTDGTPMIWTMNGTAVTSSTTLGDPGASWTLVGTGDFNNDGYSDLLFQNTDGTPAIWQMSGSAVAAGVALSNPGTAWKVVGTGDFNGDGKSDILFQNADGTPAIWEMSGTSAIMGVALSNPGTAWKVVGTGDFNGDGKSDILLQNADGTPAIWEMSGGTLVLGAALPNPGAAWQAIGTGDFNRDGKSDILFQNTTTGAPMIWTMNGTTVTSTASLASPGINWHASTG